MLVTPEDQIPIVEVEDSYSSSLMQDFLWFTKVDRKEETVIDRNVQQQMDFSVFSNWLLISKLPKQELFIYQTCATNRLGLMYT